MQSTEFYIHDRHVVVQADLPRWTLQQYQHLVRLRQVLAARLRRHCRPSEKCVAAQIRDVPRSAARRPLVSTENMRQGLAALTIIKNCDMV